MIRTIKNTGQVEVDSRVIWHQASTPDNYVVC